MIARRYSAKKLSFKISQNSQRNSCVESLFNTVEGLQAISPATLLKRELRTGVSEPAVADLLQNKFS